MKTLLDILRELVKHSKSVYKATAKGVKMTRYFILGFFICLVSVSSSLGATRKNFMDVQQLDPSIKAEMRYYSDHNFIGERIKGYEAPKCLLTKEAAQALAAVQAELKRKKLSLKVYDCYRPQKAVNHFIKWAKDINDIKMKKEFYPKVDKKNLFKDGYIAEKSGHSRGSTIDLTIDGLNMGTPYDFFDPISHTENPKIKGKAMANRLLLKRVMEKHGFKNYDKEWWHYTLKNEPFSNRYFNFAVK